MDIVQKINNELQRLRDQKKNIEEEIQRLEKVKEQPEKVLQTLAAVIESGGHGGAPRQAMAIMRHVAPKGPRVTSMAYKLAELVIKRGKPIRNIRHEAIPMLAEVGVRPGGKDPALTLSARLSRDKRWDLTEKGW